jgi:hypothetical protein
LQELSEKHRPILLNIQFNRRRRQKLNPVRQRPWFASADQWVTVTASLTDAPPTFFEVASHSFAAASFSVFVAFPCVAATCGVTGVVRVVVVLCVVMQCTVLVLHRGESVQDAVLRVWVV